VNQYFNACQWKVKTRKNEGNLITIQETSQPKKSRKNTDEVNYYMKTTSTLSKSAVGRKNHQSIQSLEVCSIQMITKLKT